RRRLGHERSAAGAEIAAGPGRLADVPYLARRRGLYRSVVLYRDPRQWRQSVVRLAPQREGRSRDHRLVRGEKSRRRKGRHRAAEQGRIRGRRLRADRLLPGLSGLAQECRRDREGAATVLLGREQSGLNAFPIADTPAKWHETC